MTTQLNQLSFPELQELSSNIQKELKARSANIIKEARAELRELERKYSLTVEEILSGNKTASEKSSDAKKTVAPKYRNPENAEETWTGRGKKPKWVEAALAQGQSIDALLIQTA